MSNEHRNNHYVPMWYQKRFLPPGQGNNELYYLDLKPPYLVDRNGVAKKKRATKLQGPRLCFFERDLYTRRVGSVESTDIERVFFGQIDDRGRRTIDYIAHFTHPLTPGMAHSPIDGDAYRNFIIYMSAQKLRTPKGLDWLATRAPTGDRNQLLAFMLEARDLYAAIWTESIWLLADACGATTKFIISDHPVTVYNRECPPGSRWCQYPHDPDVRYHATHTIFPLSLDKVLVLTNLSWVRNPHQHGFGYRPNREFFRPATFKFMDIQVLRHLSDREVTEINFIIKKRATRYVAAAREEWLYPEKTISPPNWATFADSYLLMPDPRSVRFSNGITYGNRDGSFGAIDEYGRRPGDPGFRDEERSRAEAETFRRFQGEFARLFGTSRRGRAFRPMSLDPERDDDDSHNYHSSLEHEEQD